MRDDNISPAGKGELCERQPNPTNTGGEHHGPSRNRAGKAWETTSATAGYTEMTSITVLEIPH